MGKLGIWATRCTLLLALGACDRSTTPNAAPRAVATASAGAPLRGSPNAPQASTQAAGASSTSPGDVPAASGNSAKSAASAASDPLILPAAQIYQPSGLAKGERRPLLIFLHGLGASGKTAFDVLRLAAFGARERVFVIAPDGAVDGQKRQFWNAGSACCNFDHRDIDDVARLGQLIDAWRARPDVDSNRIYVTGHSNGGFMTERLACALGDRIT
ncbi:MAG TPA: PHB depolymerase family esterase, partial [Polyangiaceae bacterium]|nr:PHB depolymerase family esterase [Polyangiaceae bacterium]